MRIFFKQVAIAKFSDGEFECDLDELNYILKALVDAKRDDLYMAIGNEEIRDYLKEKGLINVWNDKYKSVKIIDLNLFLKFKKDVETLRFGTKEESGKAAA